MKEAEAVWYVAHMERVTAREIAEVAEEHSQKTVSTILLECLLKGYLVRKKRVVDDSRRNPYEYALAPADATTVEGL